MSSEAETQQAPQPAADEEGPSSPAAAASAGDKKVIGKELEMSSLAPAANELQQRTGSVECLGTSQLLVLFTPRKQFDL